ncbi:MAG TPA: thiamine pyrophosphate-binding protein, partial [Streptosporangiales bacterium]
VAALAAHEVDTVFGIPGTHNLPIYAHLGAYGIRHVSPRHEQGAGFAADGYARVTGCPGVVLTTTGPGVLNAVTALAEAYSDSVPVLVVAPGMPLAHPGSGNGYLHEVRDQHAALSAVTAGGERVGSVAEIPYAVTRAFAAMATGRPRPRYLEIPLDLLDEVADVEIPAPVAVAMPVTDAGDVGRAAELLGYARRPGILVGGGSRGAYREVRSLAERLEAPVAASVGGKGVLAEDHPLALGAGLHHRSVAAFAADCDVLLAVGTELAPADLWNGPLPIDGELVRVDIDPAQVTANAHPDAALVGDAADVLRGLREMLGPRPRRGGRHAVVRLEDRAREWRTRVRADARAEGRRWLELLEIVDAVVGRDGIVAGDSATVCYYGAIGNLPRYLPRTFLYPAGLGTLGYGLPAAIGASVGWPGTRVLALHGDGGFLFTAPELATAAQLGLPLPVLVIDNGGYGEIRAEMRARGDQPVGVDLTPVDFAGLATSLGCHGVRVRDLTTLADALEAAFNADRPTVLHVEEAA